LDEKDEWENKILDNSSFTLLLYYYIILSLNNIFLIILDYPLFISIKK
jgi:hypothetical protein